MGSQIEHWVSQAQVCVPEHYIGFLTITMGSQAEHYVSPTQVNVFLDLVLGSKT